MRLTEQQAKDISHLAHQMAGETARVRLFGSRLDESAKGGDADLPLEIPEPVTDPVLLAARFAARVSRLTGGAEGRCPARGAQSQTPADTRRRALRGLPAMQPSHEAMGRLQLLVRVVDKECRYLQQTGNRLFDVPFTPERTVQLETQPDLAERVEAFVGRFGRLKTRLGTNCCPRY